MKNNHPQSLIKSYQNIVREFFGNIKFRVESLESKVKGIRIFVNVLSLGQLFKMPTNGSIVYKLDEWRVGL